MCAKQTGSIQKNRRKSGRSIKEVQLTSPLTELGFHTQRSLLRCVDKTGSVRGFLYPQKNRHSDGLLLCCMHINAYIKNR